MNKKLLKILGVIMIALGGFIIGISFSNLFVFDRHGNTYWCMEIVKGGLVIVLGLLNTPFKKNTEKTTA